MSSQRLRPINLVVGDYYYSPSGRLCKLMPSAKSGIQTSAYFFAYLSKGKTSAEDGFYISHNNQSAIGAMRPAGGPQLTPASVLAVRGLA